MSAIKSPKPTAHNTLFLPTANLRRYHSASSGPTQCGQCKQAGRSAEFLARSNSSPRALTPATNRATLLPLIGITYCMVAGGAFRAAVRGGLLEHNGPLLRKAR